MDASSSSMDHSAAASGECQVSMLWNWNTIDSCFLTESWHIRTQAQFVGSCIGVALLVVVFEGLRRLEREYSRWLARRQTVAISQGACCPCDVEDEAPKCCKSAGSRSSEGSLPRPTTVRAPTRLELGGHHVVRSLGHAVLFLLAYILMLLGMSFSIQIFISIIVGAFLGHLAFAWDLTMPSKEACSTPKSGNTVGDTVVGTHCG